MAKRRAKKDDLAFRVGSISARPLCGWIVYGVPCAAPGEMGPYPTFKDKHHDVVWFVSPCKKHWKPAAEKRDDVFKATGFQIAGRQLIEEFRVWVTKHFGAQTFAVKNG